MLCNEANVARCPEHGLHGERTECFVCGGPVEQVRMVAMDAAEQALATILADYAVTTRTAQPRRVQPGEVISRLRIDRKSVV